MEKKENSEYKENKTIEELAREAMDAIKESQDNEQRKIDRELKEQIKRQEIALKEEIERKIKKKLRIIEKKESKKQKEDEIDTRFVVKWTNPDKVGRKYIGEYEDEIKFTITRGIQLFHLKINENNLILEEWRKNAHTSINLDTLKIKADKILKKAKDIKNK